MTSLESRLLKSLQIILDDESLTTETELFLSGRLDSLTTLSLAELVFREYGVRMEAENINPEVLGSITSISAWISSFGPSE